MTTDAAMMLIGPLTAPAGLLALLVLMIATRRRDPYGRDDVRAVMFSGFARERLLAAIIAAITCLIATSLSMGDSKTLLGLQTVFGLYCVTGSLLLLGPVLRSSVHTRNCDPCLRALVLAIVWPLWLRGPGTSPR